MTVCELLSHVPHASQA